MATRIVSQEEREKQNYYMQCVRDFNSGRGGRPAACIKTFGCQMNEHDSEKLAGMLERMGYEPVSYTHLDVYKRQDPGMRGLRSRTYF